MRRPQVVSRVRFVVASTEEQEGGLLGYLSYRTEAPLILDGVTLRRTQAGRLALSYPERRDSEGRRHSTIRPADDAARRAIEAAVFAALRAQVGTAP